jgi:hypothetical protein
VYPHFSPYTACIEVNRIFIVIFIKNQNGEEIGGDYRYQSELAICLGNGDNLIAISLITISYASLTTHASLNGIS